MQHSKISVGRVLDLERERICLTLSFPNQLGVLFYFYYGSCCNLNICLILLNNVTVI
jgi:hypothetical protein